MLFKTKKKKIWLKRPVFEFAVFLTLIFLLPRKLLKPKLQQKDKRFLFCMTLKKPSLTQFSLCRTNICFIVWCDLHCCKILAHVKSVVLNSSQV